MQSLLIGEGATRDQKKAIRSALSDGEKLRRTSELRTQYLGPDELLVVAKVAVSPELSAGYLAESINQAEDRVRACVPDPQRGLDALMSWWAMNASYPAYGSRQVTDMIETLCAGGALVLDRHRQPAASAGSADVVATLG